MEEQYKYTGIFCTRYIPWAGLLIVAAITLYKANIYFSIVVALLSCIIIVQLIRCKIKSPDNIVEIKDNLITINLPGGSKSISADSILSFELKSNKIIMHIKGSESIEVPAGYWQTTNDMKHFIATTEKSCLTINSKSCFAPARAK